MAVGLMSAPAARAEAQRRQVEQALRAREMGAYLAGIFGAARAAGASHEPLECRILDVKYEPGEYCTVLYLLGDRMVIGTMRWDGTEDETPATAQLIAPLGMRVYPFDQDPALPGLAIARDPQAIAAVLTAALPECRDGAARVVRCRITVLRYRPGKRCTLRYDFWLRDARTGAARPRTLFAKVYHQLAKATSVYAEMQMLCSSAPACDGRVVFARPAAFLPELQIVVQEPIEGTPLELLLEGMRGAVTAGDRRGWEGVVHSAAALAALHTAGLSTPRERPIAAELKRFQKRAGLAAAVDPTVGAELIELARALPAWLERLPEWDAQITLVHGDCKHSQCMLTPAGVAILDFDHCGMADPASDIGTYLATLRQLGIHQALKAHGSAASAARTRWLRALEDRFLEEYCAVSGFSTGFRLRATWYEAVALMRKALRGFARAPRSPMPLAQVEEAWRILATLGGGR